MTTPEIAALVSVGWACLAIAMTIARAWRRGTSRVVATPAGSAWHGIAYAFGPGMSPTAKESASDHLGIYACGMLYHVGIGAGAATLVVTMAGIPVPWMLRHVGVVVLLLAAASGAVLLARRVATPLLRLISAPDDYASNLLVDAWLATAAMALLLPQAASTLLFVTAALGIYAPFGKIRHCAFFFLARAQFGARLGRRGVVRPRGREARA